MLANIVSRGGGKISVNGLRGGRQIFGTQMLASFQCARISDYPQVPINNDCSLSRIGPILDLLSPNQMASGLAEQLVNSLP